MDFKGFIDTRRGGTPDGLLFLAVFVLSFIGLAMVFSASAIKAYTIFGDTFFFIKRQVIWVVLSLVAVLILQAIDYRKYFALTKYFLLVSIVVLAALYIPGIGHAAKGSVRWINFGFFAVQPSEFVKILTIIYLAKIFSNFSHDEHNSIGKLLVPLLILSVIFLLIMLQPDFGTAVTLLVVSIAVLFVSGFPALYLAILFVISIPAFYLLIYQVNYRWARIIAFLDPWDNRYSIGYHITQSFTAFKKGGILGQGLGNGTLKVARLPEPHTDFIFAVIGEETGILGSVAVIALFLYLFYRGMRISMKASDDFGRLLAIALTLSIVVQAMLNICVVTGLLPTTGIPLPFISYGGSSLLSNMIAVGILLNISKYRDVVPETFKKNDEFEVVE